MTKKIISFSLWGDNSKYTVGAIRNITAAKQFYPGWICRFYVGDDVPEDIQASLVNDNTEVIRMAGAGWNGMFWRFLAADSDDIVISRDTDSRLGHREAAAVHEWLESDKDFHIMRDHPYHATEILGGMWGVRNGLLKDISTMILDYERGKLDNKYQVDQAFLRDVVYPMVRGRAMVHDEFFEKKPFPIDATPRSPHYFVGQVYNHLDEPEFLMKNVVIIQENGHHIENRNFRECFCLQRALRYHGARATVWGLGHDNYSIVPNWDDYDLVINLENYDMTGWVPNLSQIKAKKFLWSIDAHVKGLRSYLMTAMSGKYDRILQATPEYVDHKSVWFPNCYDDTLIKPLKTEKKYDVGFCGNVVNRQPLIDHLKVTFDSSKFDEFVIGRSMVEAINSYKVHWNCNIGTDINYRNFETMGCGTFLITSSNKWYDQLGIVDEKNCYTYNTVQEMLMKIKHILKYDDYREEIADKGYQLVSRNHTYKNRAQTILEYLDDAN